QAAMDRPMLIRVFAPDEKLVLRHDDPGTCTQDAAALEHEATLTVPSQGVGVYQIAVSAFAAEIFIDAAPDLAFGVYASPRLRGAGDQFERASIYLPPGLQRLPIAVDGLVERLTLSDETGAVQLELRDGLSGGEARIPSS